MWDQMKKLYQQTNKARKFYFDIKIANYCQGDKTVQKYYSGFLALWTEKDLILFHSRTSEFLPRALKFEKEVHISQFLVNLHSKFESVRAALMN